MEDTDYYLQVIRQEQAVTHSLQSLVLAMSKRLELMEAKLGLEVGGPQDILFTPGGKKRQSTNTKSKGHVKKRARTSIQDRF